jgi:hypothetical protein
MYRDCTIFDDKFECMLYWCLVVMSSGGRVVASRPGSLDLCWLATGLGLLKGISRDLLGQAQDLCLAYTFPRVID